MEAATPHAVHRSKTMNSMDAVPTVKPCDASEHQILIQGVDYDYSITGIIHPHIGIIFFILFYR